MWLGLLLVPTLFACMLQTGLAQANVENVNANSTLLQANFSSSITPKSAIRAVRFIEEGVEVEDSPARVRRNSGNRGYQAPRPSGGSKYSPVSSHKLY